MKSFYSKFTKYENCIPPGVRLPKINIEEKFYKELGLDSSCSNFAFLNKLCESKLNDLKRDLKYLLLSIYYYL